MSKRAVCLRAPPFIAPPGYARHRPEATLLYQLVERCCPEFVALCEAAGRPLRKYVQEEFETYLMCGRLGHAFIRVRRDHCRVGKLVAFSCKRWLKVIASIEEPALIERILERRRERREEDAPVSSLGPRAPPPESLF